MAAQVAQGSPLALQLQNVVHPKLVEAGWSSDDTTLSEYIVLMLANGKDQDQVANELATDLLSLDPGDRSAYDFSQWLFEQVAQLTGQGAPNEAQQAQPDAQTAPAQAIPTGPSADSDIGMDVDQAQTAPPTGPKSMRNGNGGVQRGNTRRQLGQMNRALDRTNDSALHKVRNTSSERIGRNAPRGPRGGIHGAQFGAAAGAGRGGPRHGSQLSNPQQNQLMQFIGQQMEMMQQVLNGQAPQALLGGMNGAAINPHFRATPASDRGGRGGRGGKFHDRKPPQHQNGAAASQSGDAEMTGDGMDTDVAGEKKAPSEAICRFNLKCTKVDCPFVHQSPAARPGITIDMKDTCSFGASCKNSKCVGKHPSPAQRTAFQQGQECKFWPNCTNANCPFKHPDTPMCKFGGDCTREDCSYTHNRTMCKYNPCLNPKCFFKHAEGQKKSATWTKDSADSNMSGEHVSERKFNSAEDGAEELIKPGVNAEGQQEDTEIAT